MLSALALCEHVDVHAVGWLALGGELVESNAFDRSAGRCVRPSDAERAPDAAPRSKGDAKGASWRTERLHAELLLHVWHAFGIVRWVM